MCRLNTLMKNLPDPIGINKAIAENPIMSRINDPLNLESRNPAAKWAANVAAKIPDPVGKSMYGETTGGKGTGDLYQNKTGPAR